MQTLTQVLIIIGIAAVGIVVMMTNTMRLRKTLDELKKAKDEVEELKVKVTALEMENENLASKLMGLGKDDAKTDGRKAASKTKKK